MSNRLIRPNKVQVKILKKHDGRENMTIITENRNQIYEDDNEDDMKVLPLSTHTNSNFHSNDFGLKPSENSAFTLIRKGSIDLGPKCSNLTKLPNLVDILNWDGLSISAKCGNFSKLRPAQNRASGEVQKDPILQVQNKSEDVQKHCCSDVPRVSDENIARVDNKNNSQIVDSKECKDDTNDQDPALLRYTRHGDLSQRRDVVLKTIIRDLRKYYVDEFNELTCYLKKKRYRRKDFYIDCVHDYIQKEHIKPVSMKNGRNIRDFSIYLGALIYPKEFQKIVTKSKHKIIIDETFDALYKFSLGKMKSFLTMDAISSLFMNYYRKAIKEGDRLETNKTMVKHKPLYLEAFKILASYISKPKKSNLAFYNFIN